MSEIMIKGLKKYIFCHLVSRRSYPCSSANQQNFHRESERDRESDTGMCITPSHSSPIKKEESKLSLICFHKWFFNGDDVRL